MIVEDMIVMQEILREIFNLRGYNVVFSASDGNEAVNYFLNSSNELPDIVIMDHIMPNKDGLTALKEIKAIYENIKVVFVSADENARKEALEGGAIAYLLKPIAIKDVLKLIEKLAAH